LLKTRICGVIAALAAVAAITPTGAATAASMSGLTGGRTATSVLRPPSPTTNPIGGGGSTSVPLTAFPTGGKGSGTEATCDLWGGQLNYDQGAVEAAIHNNDLQQYQDAKAKFDADYDETLNAGCAIID